MKTATETLGFDTWVLNPFHELLYITAGLWYTASEPIILNGLHWLDLEE